VSTTARESAVGRPVVDEAQRRKDGTATFTLTHAPTFLAVAAVLLYTAGLFRTLAILNAEDVQPVRGLPLAPLQTYFVQGLALALTSVDLVVEITLLVTAPLLVVYFAVQLLVFRNTWGADVNPVRQTSTVMPVVAFWKAIAAAPKARRWLPALGTMALIIAAAAAFFTPLAYWAPYVPAALALLVGIGMVMPTRLHDWTARRGQALSGTFLCAATLFLLVPGWCRPPALDQVAVRWNNQNLSHYKLLTQTEGTAYVVAQNGPRNDDTEVIAIPLDQVRRLRVTAGHARYYKTPAELLNIDFLRLENEHGSLHFHWL
jgi:hypothetical protein